MSFADMIRRDHSLEGGQDDDESASTAPGRDKILLVRVRVEE